MKDTVEKLARARCILAEYDATLVEAEEKLHATPEWAAADQALQDARQAKVEQANIETEVREQALGIYEETGDKAPHPAVKVKMYTVLDYDPARAFDYAREHLPQALKLNKKVFETAAKGIELDFVDIVQEPRATITRDLSGYLPED